MFKPIIGGAAALAAAMAAAGSGVQKKRKRESSGTGSGEGGLAGCAGAALGQRGRGQAWRMGLEREVCGGWRDLRWDGGAELGEGGLMGGGGVDGRRCLSAASALPSLQHYLLSARPLVCPPLLRRDW